MSLVLDSSATLAWIYGDETTDAIRAVFEAVADNGAVVPALRHGRRQVRRFVDGLRRRSTGEGVGFGP